MRRALSVSLLVAALGAAAAEPAAGAVTVSKPAASTALQVDANGITTRVRLAIVDAGTNVRFDFLSPVAAADVAPAAPCVFDGAGPDVKCPSSGITRVVVNLSPGADLVDGSALGAFPIPITADGGAGADSLTGGAAADQLNGGADGDVLSGRDGADDLAGGAGFDVASYATLADAVRVSIDDVADDGRVGGAEGDNVRTDVEDLTGGAGSDTLIGSAAGNVLTGGAGNDTVDGGGGFDEYILGDGNDTAQARDGNGERINCGSGADTATMDDVDETSDCETVQASGDLVRDLDKDGASEPEDCDDGNAGIRPGAQDTPDDGIDQDCSGADARRSDLDGDGHALPADCDDGNAAARPGAAEVYGNAVDENCDGIAAPLAVLVNPVLHRFLAGRTTRIARLVVLDLAPGTAVVVRCAGRRCPFRARTIAVTRAGRLDLRTRLRLRSLRPGVVLELRILRPDSIGRVVRYRFRARRQPTRQILCQAPADAAPRRC